MADMASKKSATTPLLDAMSLHLGAKRIHCRATIKLQSVRSAVLRGGQ